MNAIYNSRLLSREYVCFKLVVGFVVLGTIGSVSARRVSGNRGGNVIIILVEDFFKGLAEIHVSKSLYIEIPQLILYLRSSFRLYSFP
jgi:hypothetical protein